MVTWGMEWNGSSWETVDSVTHAYFNGNLGTPTDILPGASVICKHRAYHYLQQSRVTSTTTTTTPPDAHVDFDRIHTRWVIYSQGSTSNVSINSDAAHPLDAEPTSTADLAFAEVSDFSGEFEGSMPAGKKRRPRKYPQVLQLKVVKPKYKEECKDAVTPGEEGYTKEKMNEELFELSDSSNPCKGVAGKWEDGTPKGFAYKTLSGDKEAGVDYQAFDQCQSELADKTLKAAEVNYGRWYVNQLIESQKHKGPGRMLKFVIRFGHKLREFDSDPFHFLDLNVVSFDSAAT